MAPSMRMKCSQGGFTEMCNSSKQRRNFPRSIRTNGGAATLPRLKRWGDCFLQRERKCACLNFETLHA
jgi:hypothetical protein